MEHLLGRITDLFPIVSGVQGCWKSEKGLKLKLDHEQLNVPEKHKPTLERLRSSSKTDEWIVNFNLEQLNGHGTLQQSNFSDEQAMRNWMIFFNSPIDGKKDFLVLFFPESISMHNNDVLFNALTAREKYFIQMTYLPILQAEWQRCLEESQLLFDMQKIFQQQQKDLNNEREKLAWTRAQYVHSLSAHCTQLTKSIEQEIGCTHAVNLSQSALEKIAKSGWDIDTINHEIRRVTRAVLHLIGSQTNEILIDEGLIDLNRKRVIADKNNAINMKSKVQDKTSELLDRYETSARKCEALGISINSKNISAHMEPPITPSAISDAVKKNRRKIKLLIENDFERWPLIALNLKAIQRILENDSFGMGKAV